MEGIYRGLTEEIYRYLIGGTVDNYRNPQSRPRFEQKALLLESASPVHIFKEQAYDI
jgi:hypothetical protein